MYTSHADHSNNIELVAISKSKNSFTPNVTYVYVHHTCLSFYPAKYSTPVSILSLLRDLSPILHHIYLLNHGLPEQPQGLQNTADLLQKGFCKVSVSNNG